MATGLEMAVMNFDGRPGDEISKSQRTEGKGEGEAKGGKPKTGKERTRDRDTRARNHQPGVESRRQIANKRSHNLSLYPSQESVNFPQWMRVC